MMNLSRNICRNGWRDDFTGMPKRNLSIRKHSPTAEAQQFKGGTTKADSPTSIRIRVARSADLSTIRELTVASFAGVTLEENVERALGILNNHDWRWRKARHIDDDFSNNRAGVFVAVTAGRVVGYVTTLIDASAGKGRIPNLAVAPEFRGHGLGRKLIERALESFRKAGLVYAMIETMAQNDAGRHLYPACGFVEVARQVHFARKL